ncbi:hypothetical protein CEUSTIGMA_g8933.t1 [Chlamydomonas eustigma]|uniref:Serine aminopeptidase S33 domain-containing protein n=1 Tax=Chlamydomonas eustigma TaxID=1157962 RepID=A0A250XEJ6_9CHLO|nr:hypothetical protein CEUSTIGMA_g8933.t1 [Chlamydomonas eustigma]|eukprot:GAX81505.1 hypothetical protein CEUSTIGMA_g8933.t1 [Chlamydomonas eustigma]
MAPGPWGRFVEHISGKLAFFPPRPPTYQVLEHLDGTGDLYLQPSTSDIPRVLHCDIKRLETKATKRGGHGGGSTIITAYVPYRWKSNHSSAKMTILYSHGNAVDLGQMLPVYREISKLLKVNVMGYDYSGYGCSSGDMPSVGHTLADISAVYQYMVQEMKLPPKSIILYGQSVGSGPTAFLGAQESEVAGVVLHSPLLSGIRVLSPGLKWWPAFADVYPNHLLVPKINAPTLVMHGTEDEVIHFSCGVKLHELCKNKVEPLWAEGFNHQNLEMCPQYLPTMESFIAAATQALLSLEEGAGQAAEGAVPSTV